MKYKPAKLILKDGSQFEGFSFGYNKNTNGEVVFNTGMVGYPESLTDPSYYGQILVLTYPLIGNYGVPNIKEAFESKGIKPRALVVAQYIDEYSHYQAKKSLAQWLKEEKIPAIFGVDTRALTKKLREKGVMLGKVMVNDKKIDFKDPNERNLAKEVSIKKPKDYGKRGKKIILVDCGVKENIIRELLKRKVRIKRVPWDYDYSNEEYEGVFISSGPGDPEKCEDTIFYARKAMKEGRPVFGICLGSQIMGLAAGGKTYKLKYGHRAQNQPCIERDTKRCYLTTQNHGYAIKEGSMPADWQTWFLNANDNTIEGIRHKSKPFYSVQFHPEAKPGPVDTEFLFDEFIGKL
ncbi:MAG: glutamine-hydrolyzing carbamoyl-phosphate synthase small subunit [Patescibacteria group bacterium]